MSTLATIIDGEVDAADVLFLIAVILFAVGAVLAGMRRAVEQVLLFAGLAVTALAWLVL